MLEQRNHFLEAALRESQSGKDTQSSPSAIDQLSVNTGQAGPATVDDGPREVDNLSSMIGTLSLNAAGSEPSYLGSSSAFAFARFMKPSIREAVSSLPPTLSRPTAGDYIWPPPEPCPLPDYQTAVQLSNAYFQNIHPQYPFLNEPSFRMWEAALEDPLEAMNSLDYNAVPLYFLNMVLIVIVSIHKYELL